MMTKTSWKNWKMRAGIAALALGMLGMGTPCAIGSGQPAISASAPTQEGPNYEAWLNKQVHHELAMVPWYGVFDILGYSVNGTQVTLTGQVVNPATKSDAVGSVKHIEGVTAVVDNITVLPLSSMDNQIRRAEYRAIFSYAGLYRYAMGANPSIHIIVDNGHVTLVGYVDNKTDSQMAYTRANMVPGVFSVTNNLQVG
ncbi:MAG: BON domain-containing protein [Candidatus Acidiferrales bacterium]